MATIKEYLDYAELAQVSYGDLVTGMFGKDNTVYIDELTRKDSDGEIEFSATQAENFADHYKVLATSAEYGIGNISSFDAVLFLDTQTGKKVMAIRGSQEIMDYVVDVGLGLNGLVYGQNVSLNNFYDALVVDNKLSVVEKIDVTGHSLGGYLAQLFTAEHPYVVDNAYTYNAPGIGGLNQELQELFGLKNQSDYNNKITNIYAEDGDEFVSGLGVMLGTTVPLSIDNVDPLSNHRIPYTTESLHIYNMLSSITNTQNLNLLTSILEHTSNEKALSIVSDVFQSEVSGSVVDKAIELTKKWSGDAAGLTSLVDKTASQLQSKRVENIYALLNLNPFVIEGDYLPAYADINPADYSDMYMQDRADYLYYILDKDARYGGGTGKDSYKAWDTNRVALQGTSGDQVIFGTNNLNNSYQLDGGAGNDRIYGLGGDDTFAGGGGNDYLEGGKGSDTLQGGADYDTYITDNGDTIKDSDGAGLVLFEGFKLSRGVAQGECTPNGDGEYRGDGGVYQLSGSNLTFTKDGTNETLSVQNFRNGDLGISLTSKDPGASCPPPPPPAPGKGGSGSENFSSPLVLDLNGDGITSTFISEGSTHFDLDSNGVREHTGWVQNTDALLAFDKNQDGIINDGSELFGNNTILKNGTKAANGFEALKEYDENKDGAIDAKDNIYNAFQLWQDTNSDGTTDTGELHTLKELAVASINLGYTQTTDYEERNAINQTSTFTTTDGATKSINDVWFMINNMDTAHDTTITLKETVAALPDYRGAGRAENLSVAMNENVELETAVNALLAKSSTATYSSLLGDVKNILALWTKTDNISATATRGEQYIMNHNYANAQPIYSYRIFAYARDVAILETFWGQNFTMVVNGKITSDVIGTEMSAYMTNAINTLTDTVLATLLVQQLYGKDAYDVTNGSFDYTGLFTKLSSTLTTGTTEEKTTASNLLATLIHRDGLETLLYLDTSLLINNAFKTLLSANGITYATNTDGSISGSYQGIIEGTSGNDTIQSATDGTVYGGAGNDVIYGSNGSYTYSSTGNATGNEELHGGAGNDTIYGGTGSDILYGDDGDDILYANSINSSDGNYGHDILIGGTGNDTLVGTGRNSTYIYNYGDGFDTIIDGGNVGYTPDMLELRGIRFEDIRVGHIGNDMIISIKDAVDSDVDNGSITIKNGMSSGKIERFVLDDKTLYFTTIQLIAEGLLKDDVYSFNRGIGTKTINDLGSIKGDILQFGDGITAANIEIKVSSTNNNLVVGLKKEGKTFSELNDKLTITNWFNPDNRIETFTFSDGTTWDANAILAHQGSDEADTTRLLDSTNDMTLDMGAGNDTITTANGNDTITAGEGNDTVSTGSGNDILIGGTGNDILIGSTGNDMYIFNRGDGADTIIDEDRYAPYYWNPSYMLTRNAGNDTLQFGEGISADDIISKVATNGIDLIVGFKEAGVAFDDLSDKITLKNWFEINSRVEKFVFSDGTIWSVNDIIGTQVTEADDIIRPADMTLPTNIHLLSGNDYITTGTANDTVYGDSGNDAINTGLGNDTLIGGEGNDSLQGGVGDDAYIFNLGDGADTIIEVSGNDTLSFGEGITQSNILLRQEGNNLRISIKEGSASIDDLSDRIVVKDWFSIGSRLENFSFSDGSTLIGAEEILTLIGSDANDTLAWTESVLAVSMGAGNDTVTLGTGDDTLVGGTGNDTLKGGGGNDTYMFAKGDGSDIIIDEDRYAPYYWNPNYTLTRNAGTDTLRFKDTITTSDLIVKASANSNDLIVAIKEDGVAFDDLTDKITLKNWFNADNRIESFSFSDNTSWNVNDIVNAQGTEDDDTVHLVDSTTDVTLNLKDGNDTVTTANGNDTLEGGTGNDTLSGGAGDDTYVFAKGDGIDTIIETSGTDTLRFDSTITTSDLIVKASANSNDLIVALKEDGVAFANLTNKITLKNWFDSKYRIENIEFADGIVWNVNDIVNAQGTEDADTVHLVDSTTDVTLNLRGGNDTVTTANGNDTLEGGTGNDTLSGGAGNDTYIFSRGDGIDTIIDIDGEDTLRFGEGITANDIIVQAIKGSNDLIVAIKEDGKIFDELSDKIILKNWYSNENRIETFSFTSGDALDTLAITELQLSDSDDNYLRYLDHDNTINAHEGNDVIEGGAGNDTYIFNRGDGIDHIADITGMDTLVFGTDITSEDIEVHADNNYLIIGLKEDGKTFDELSDKVYFKRVGIDDYGIETLKFADGEELDLRSLISTYDGTDGNDTIDLAYLKTINPTVSIDDSLVINAKAGNDTVILGSGSNTIDMGDGYNESLTVGSGDNQIDMGSGWNKSLTAGEGNNIIQATSAGLTANVGDGNNTIIANSINLTTGDGDNSITSLLNYYFSVNAIFGNGNNAVILDNDETVSHFYGGGNFDVEFGNGDNTIQIGQKPSAEVNDDLYRYGFISVDDGNNNISVKNGDGSLSIQAGIGNNTIEFSADVDRVYFNYAGEDTFVGDASGDNTITQLDDTDIEYSYYDYYGGTGESIQVTNANTMVIELGDGDNRISLSDVAQDYRLNLGDGTNTVTIGNEGSDKNYSMYSSIDTGDGDNVFSILSGDGTLVMNAGSGDNRIGFSADIDTVSITLNNGNNSITQYDSVDNFGSSYIDISGSNMNTIILGNGSTLLTARYSDDNIISTGAGVDDVYTYGSNDTYIVNIGDGSDAILDMYGIDYIVFGKGINQNTLKVSVATYDVIMSNLDNVNLVELLGWSQYNIGSGLDLLTNFHLVIQYSDNPSDKLILLNWYDTDSRIEVFQFADGSILSDHQIVSLIATDANDTVLGTEGDNTLHSGTGEDDVSGNEGNDTYLFNRGDSHDIFNEDGGFDTIKFGENITKNDLILQKVDNNLFISLKEDGSTQNDLSDTILINNWFDVSGRIERFMLSDGSTMELNEILSLVDADGVIYYGTPDEDTMEGTGIGDIIMARESNDIVNGNSGDDILFGEAGNDTLNGGAGNDLLYGGDGNDTYIIARNMGNDIIFDQSGNDTLKFAEGITSNDINVWYDNNDLMIGVEGTIARLTDWYKSNNRLETFVFDDGTVLGVQEIMALMISDGDDTIRTLEEGSTINAGEGNDTLISGKGDNVLIGGVGNDTYMIAEISGIATINDASSIDTIRFGEAISPDDLRITWIQGSEDILIQSKNSAQDGLILKNWYTAENRIEQIIFSDGTLWNAHDILDAMGSDGDDVYDGFKEQVNIIYANDGNDIVSTFDYDDTLYGGSGDDALDAGAGDDTLVGGKGNDLLFGGIGDDTYVFEYGFGKDMIFEDDFEGVDTGADRIVFAEGIGYNDIDVKSFKNDNNLYIGLKEDGKTFDELSNVITIKDWYLSNNRIESITFNDSSEMSLIDLMRTKASQNGEAITALGEGGMLMGTEEDDILLGNTGGDTLIGGEGDDFLEGSEGNDAYFFGRGDGSDTIYDNATAIQEQYGHVTDSDGIERWSKIEYEYNIDGGIDTIYFGDGITSSDLIVKNDGFDLLITFKDSSSDELRVQDYYKQFNTIEFFGFSDGMIMSGSEFEALLFTQSNDDVTFVDNQNRILYGDNGNDVINGGNGNDVIDGACGDDTLNGGFGDDMYLFGRGSGHDTISDSGIGEWWQTGSGNDRILFAGSISSEDLWVKNIGEDVIVGIKEEGKIFEELRDTLTIKGALNSANPFESLAFDVGTTVQIETLVNRAPVITDINIILLEDTSTNGVFNVTNPIGGALVYEVLNASSKGAFSVNEAGEWSYTPSANLNGNDSVVIKVTNSYGLSTMATLDFAIEAVNDAPILTEITTQITLDAGLSTSGTIKASDIDGDALSYSVTSNPEHGTLTVDDQGKWSYTAERYYAGQNSAMVSIDDGYGGSVAATLNFTNLMTPDWHYTYSGQELTINDSDGMDTLLMNTISMADLTFLQEGNGLRIDVKNKNDIILADYFTSDVKGVESVQTAEGTINLSKEYIGITSRTGPWQYGSTLDDLIAGAVISDRIYGRDGDDTIFGNAGNDGLSGNTGNDLLIGGADNDTLSGGEGNDILYGDVGNDTLSGDDGDDKLYGDKGNDTLLGGKGNDLLAGGEGVNTIIGGTEDDTYFITKGANTTTINENISDFGLFGRWFGQNGGKDTLKFGEGISKEDISFLIKGNDLLLQYGNNEFVTITNQRNEANQIEKLELNDGSYLSNTDIDLIIQQLNAYSKDYGFYINNNSQIQNNQAMMNIITSGWHQ